MSLKFIESQRFCNIVKLKNLINNTVIGEMTKSQNGMENRLANGVAQFHWKALSTIVDLFSMYKSDNNMNIAYINHLQRCPRSLVRNILLNIIMPCI